MALDRDTLVQQLEASAAEVAKWPQWKKDLIVLRDAQPKSSDQSRSDRDVQIRGTDGVPTIGMVR
jgi:hypothetical protein